MKETSRELYDFLIENKYKLTDDWLKSRVKVDGSTYSANVASQIEEQLRKQNNNFTDAVSAVFVNKREDYLPAIDEWISTIAQERASHSVQLHEVISQLRIFRGIYWSYIRKFFKEEDRGTSEDILRWSEVLNDAFDYIIESFAIRYYEANERILSSQRAMIDELSSPVIPIRKGIAILPLVGEIDTHRAKTILEMTLEQSAKKDLHTLFIDLSAVAIIDTMVAQQIFQLMASLKIIGVESVLSGIRPEIAQTAITLGISFKDITVHGNLMRALETLDKQS